MTLFILLLFFLFTHAQQKSTKQEVYKHYDAQHQKNMKLYDRLYEIRQKRHNDWLLMMKKMEENKKR